MTAAPPGHPDDARAARRGAGAAAAAPLRRRLQLAPADSGGEVLPPEAQLSPARRRVFTCAVELFGARGFHGVSVRDLALALGIQPPSLYAHVPSKQHLLREIVLIGYVGHRERLTAALLGSGPDPAEQLRAVVRAHVLTQLDFPALSRVCNNEVRHLEEEHARVAQAVMEQSAQLFLDVVDRGVRLGEFTVTNPRRAMRAIGDMGIRVNAWPAPDDPQALADDYAAFALRLLA